MTDGRWVVDDYYEDQAQTSIAEQGLRAGDLVGDLPDPRAANKAAADQADADAPQGPRGAGGMYKAGGATTIFGGSGWGPFSEGPLNAVKKSYYSREGMTEENWMWVAAERTAKASAEWKKLRSDGLKVVGGILGDIGEKEEKGGEESGREGKRRKAGYDKDELPLGIYEPQTGVVLCNSNSLYVRHALIGFLRSRRHSTYTE
jgi:chromatin structure-remodeling complex protein RSC7